eukprot:TRINITY_DN10281_c0_g1_i1.p1 TRINITY_DN10281_c0_g1~~TRINITY_DN10281_c0_g1_i1.p1  ORF type:complete len:111 (+),score=6.17 TRINITY_DN10281_c0_g1_i1:40-333(+)
MSQTGPDEEIQPQGLLEAIVLSITRGGVPSQLITFTIGTLFALIVIILILIITGYGSIHFFIFLILALGLLISFSWFMYEINQTKETTINNKELKKE